MCVGWTPRSRPGRRHHHWWGSSSTTDTLWAQQGLSACASRKQKHAFLLGLTAAPICDTVPVSYLWYQILILKILVLINHKWKCSTHISEAKLLSETWNNDGVPAPQKLKPVLENKKLFLSQTQQATSFMAAWNEFTGFPWNSKTVFKSRSVRRRKLGRSERVAWTYIHYQM